VEEARGCSPTRLRGGGRRPISLPLYSSEEEDQPEEPDDEAEHQVLKKREEDQEMAPTGSNNEPIPGPSSQGRSRSPINMRSQMRRIASRSKSHGPTVTDEETSSPIEILSEDYSSPRVVLKQERQSPVTLRSSDEDREKVPKLPPKATEDNARSAEGSCSSTTDESSTEPKAKRRCKKKKMRTGTVATKPKPDIMAANIEELRANAAERGRPPTYINVIFLNGPLLQTR